MIKIKDSGMSWTIEVIYLEIIRSKKSALKLNNFTLRATVIDLKL